MNLFQKQMQQDMNHFKSIREQIARRKEVEVITGEKFPYILKQQAGYPMEKNHE